MPFDKPVEMVARPRRRYIVLREPASGQAELPGPPKWGRKWPTSQMRGFQRLLAPGAVARTGAGLRVSRYMAKMRYQLAAN
jgi:hypothetical protein